MHGSTSNDGGKTSNDQPGYEHDTWISTADPRKDIMSSRVIGFIQVSKSGMLVL